MADPLSRGFQRDPSPLAAESPADGVTIIVEDAPEPALDGDGAIDAASGALKLEVTGGGVVIDFNPQPKARKRADEKFDDNLAESLPESVLGQIASDLFMRIQSDDTSRSDWLQTRAKGIDLLGLKIEEPRGDGGASSAPVEGQSTVRHPLLLEATIRFQSNAAAELLPAGGPVKVRNDAPAIPPGSGDTTPPELKGDSLAELLEKDLNHYLTKVDKGYRADTDRMLFWVGFGGAMFKKVYNCPIRRMPISRSVDAADLIVSNSANDTDDAGRITHQIKMRRSTLIRMQIAGVYRALDGLTRSQPQMQPNAVEQKVAQTQGFTPTPQHPEDNLFTIYECYAELDLPGYEHRDKEDRPTGLELPYRVTIEKDSQRILEIRRNWREDDENCLAKRVFVKFPFVPAMGFYDIGLLHILGNSTKNLTAAWREMLDAGMFANFPGFLYADTAGRQVTNQFRVPPGGGQKIQTGGKPIQDAVMAIPYKDVLPGLAALVEKVEATGQRVGGTAELQVAEGRQDAPVGTTLAMIEQATKLLAAVHIRLHAAQSEEFQLLKERFKEDPEAFWRHNRKPAKRWEVTEFLAALEDSDLVPQADPNTASNIQRIMKSVAVKQLQAMNPQLYDAKAVDRAVLRNIGIEDPDALFGPDPDPNQAPPAPPVDPAKMAMVQLKQEELARKTAADQQEQAADAAAAARAEDARQQEVAVESSDRAADRESRERVAQLRKDTEELKLQGEARKQQESQAHERQMQARDIGAERQKHGEQLAADQQQHIAGLAADHHQATVQAGLERGGVVSDHLKHARETQADLVKHAATLAQQDAHHRDAMAQAEADRAAQQKQALAGAPTGKPRPL